MAVDSTARAMAAGKTPVDAYQMAVAGGYTGTKQEFETLMGNSGNYASAAAASAAEAAASAVTAANVGDNLASEYDSSSETGYAVGDYVLYSNVLYRCKNPVAPNSAWNASDWEAVNFGEEIDNLGDELTDLQSEKADAIHANEEGAIASFPDGADGMPMDSVVIAIDPVQDLHGYDRPWPEGGGKNLLKTEGLTAGVPSDTTFSNATKRTFEVGKYYTGVSYNNYYQNARVTEVSVSDNSISVTSEAAAYGVSIPVVGLTVGETYVLSAVKTGDLYVSHYQEDGTFISCSNKNPTNFTVPANTYYTLLLFEPPSNDAQGTFTNIQLEKGSTATTYSPYSNICPISGWTGAKVERCGKNLLKLVASEMISFGWNRRFPFKIKAGNYVMSCVNQFMISDVVKGAKVELIDSAGAEVKEIYNAYNFGDSVFSFTFSVTESEAEKVSMVEFRPTADNATADTFIDANIQIELGSTATAYAPYSGNTYSISWQTEAGTVYGGSLDVTSGLLTVTHAIVNLGDQSWSYNSGALRFDCTSSAQLGAKSIPDANVPDAYCSQYQVVKFNGNYSSSGPDNVLFFDSTLLRVRDKKYTDAAVFKSAMNGVQLVYELATPLTYQLTPTQITTLLGENNVWADTGDTAVQYVADTKLYIEQLTKPGDEDMTANANIASGKFFMIGNRLFLSTSAIAAGATIMPGTNCTEISLADALNQINS